MNIHKLGVLFQEKELNWGRLACIGFEEEGVMGCQGFQAHMRSDSE